jgi:uncharacterized protein with PIN domain
MIAVDTSALMAIVLNEPAADACIAALESDTEVLISAGTLAEALIVSAQRNVAAEVAGIIEGLGFEVVMVTPAATRRIAQAYGQWGGASTAPPSTSAIALPTRWRRSMPAACCLLAMISRRRTSTAFCKKPGWRDWRVIDRSSSSGARIRAPFFARAAQVSLRRFGCGGRRACRCRGSGWPLGHDRMHHAVRTQFCSYDFVFARRCLPTYRDGKSPWVAQFLG